MLPHGWVNKDEIYGPMVEQVDTWHSKCHGFGHSDSSSDRATTSSLISCWHIGTPFKDIRPKHDDKRLNIRAWCNDSTSDFDSLSSSLNLDVRANEGSQLTSE